MRSPTVELRGVQVPQLVHLPPDVAHHAAAAEAIELGARSGLVLDEAQQFTLQAGMGERSDGSWAAFEVADIEPRQNGKNDTAMVRQLAGLFLICEELQIHTAHEFPTANESFLRLSGLISSTPDLSRRIERIRWGSGEQAIETKDGCRIIYRSRTGSSGRGFAGASTIYLDEALKLEAKHLGALLPTMAVAEYKGLSPQIWYTSSGGWSTSAVLWSLRKRALLGNAGRLAYCEHTAEQLTMRDGRVVSVRPDPDDRAVWALANPTLGDRITVEFLAGQREAMDETEFMREHLCVWDPEAGTTVQVWPPEVWEAALHDDAAPSGRLSIGVDATPDRTRATIAIAGAGAVEIVVDPHSRRRQPEVFSDLGREVATIARRHNAHVAIDPAGPAGHIIPELETAGVIVVKVTGQTMGQACGALFAAVNQGDIKIRRNVDLDAAVGGARTVTRQDVWIWARRDTTVDVSPLVAVTLAWWAAAQEPPKAANVVFYAGDDD